MAVAIVITSYGDDREWKPLYTRARVSAMRQTVPCTVKQVHYNESGQSLGAYRNLAASEVLDCDKLIFLDADDELAPDYVEQMLKVEGDIIQPATLNIGANGNMDSSPALIKEVPLQSGNFIVIGAMISTGKFIEVNGFMDQPIYEDWDLWQRMVIAGAVVAKCPKAVYRVHVNESGRNSNASLQKMWYTNIVNANKPGWSKVNNV